jgi:hypothetical protein
MAFVFRIYYERMTFDDGRSHFCGIHEAGHVRLDLATDTKTGKYVRYWVSSVSAEKTGEIGSLIVDAAYRSEGTGTNPVTREFASMDSVETGRKRQ